MWSRLGEKPLSGKPVYVLDATPVIHYAKAGRLGLLSEICEPVIVEAVYGEVAVGDYPDSLLVRDLVENGSIQVYRVEDRRAVDALLRFPEIHLGEAETLVASRLLDGVAVVDDSAARAIADVFGYDVARGSLFLLFRLLSAEVLDVLEAESLLGLLVENGLYLDSRTLLKARALLEEYSAS